MIAKCDKCKPHEFQDMKYGKNYRVMNELPSEGGQTKLRCTVCGIEKSESKASVKEQVK